MAEDAEIFIGDTEGNNEDERKEKCSIGGDMPAAENDTSVDDVGIPTIVPSVRYRHLKTDDGGLPEHIHCAIVHWHAGHVVSSMTTVLGHVYVVAVMKNILLRERLIRNQLTNTTEIRSQKLVV